MSMNPCSRRSLRSIATVVMAVVMITSVFAGTAMADSGVDPADEVFIDETGDAVLVYEDETDGDATGELGLDVAESVVYGLITDDVEEDVSAAFSMALIGDEIDASGELTADRPAEISAFSMDASVEQTDQTSETAADLELVLDSQEVPETQFVQSASSSGDVVMGADEFATTGDFEVTTEMPPAEQPTGIDLEIAQDGGDYTVDVHDRDQLFQADGWETEAEAQQTLEMEYTGIAQELGGDATVTIHSHEFEEDEFGGGYLDVEYTIELENVEDGLEMMLADELATDPELDLDENEAEQIAADMLAVELDAFEVSFLEGGNTIEGDWNVAFSEFDEAALAFIDLMEAGGDVDEEFADEFDEFADAYEAQQAADLTTTTEWNVEYAYGGDTATLTMDMTSTSENWQAYVAELEDRGIDTPEFTMDASAETVGDEIDMEMSLTYSDDDLLEDAIGAAITEIENDPAADQEALEFMAAFDEAGLEVAKLDVDWQDGTVEMEMGAQFDSLATFEDAIAEEFYGLSVSHVYADLDADSSYVYATGMVGEDATEDDVYSHEAVDDDTVVYMPGEWDEDHPTLDMQQVSEYLDVDIDYDEEADDEEADDEEADDEEADDEIEQQVDDENPGFGVAVALVALLSAVLLFRRD